MLLKASNFYVGLIEGMPAYEAYTKDSITCELFRDPQACKQKFQDIANVSIDAHIRILTLTGWDFDQLNGKIAALQKQLDSLKDLRRTWWIAEKYALAVQWIKNHMVKK